MAATAGAGLSIGIPTGTLVKDCGAVSEAKHSIAVISKTATFPVKASSSLSSAFLGRRVESVHVCPHLGARTRPTAVAINEAVAVDNAATASPATTSTASLQAADQGNDDSSKAVADTQDAAAFLSDVASLIKLVDSRDIVELELKHKDYEIVIRKKEALAKAAPVQHQSQPGMHVMAHTSPMQFSQFAAPPPPPAPEPVRVAAPPPPAAAAAAPAKPSLPPMLSPMAGTVYRSPAPGEKPFVQVGDQVKKGQVVCIIEAMKLMNEIEADQSGVIVEIAVEDGKPVSIDTPLFVIKP